MAEIVKAGTPSLSTALPCNAHRLSGLIAGEAIAAGDACYIKSSDGKAYRSIGTAANAAAVVDGWAPQAVAIGEAITLMNDIRMSYTTGLTPGTFYYLSGTVAGGIADAPSTGGTVPIARSVDATRLLLRRSY